MPYTIDLIKARYVLSVLNVARLADRKSALILLEALKTELPLSGTAAQITNAQQAAISAIDSLFAAVQAGNGYEGQWNYALVRADAWRSVALNHGPTAADSEDR